MSWVNKIFIVTNGEVPRWLKTSHPKVKVISHQMIFQDKSHLPTFNSAAIETYLHHIPGLSEKFLYFNDDMLLLNDVSKDTFWTGNDGYKIPFSYQVPNCNIGCSYDMIGDGKCDMECFVDSCAADYLDCQGENLRSKMLPFDDQCRTEFIGDGKCNPECNNSNNAFDGGDCRTAIDPKISQVWIPTSEFEQHELSWTFGFARITPGWYFENDGPVKFSFDPPYMVRKLVPFHDRYGNIMYYFVVFWKTKVKSFTMTMTGHTKKATLKYVWTYITYAQFDEYSGSLMFSNLVLGESFKKRFARQTIPHSPFLVDKRIMYKLEKKYSRQFQMTRSHKLRSKYELQYSFFYHQYLVESGQKYENVSSDRILFVPLTNNAAKVEKLFKNSNNPVYKFACFNDDMDDVANPSVVAMLHQFYQSKFPKASSFEK